MRQTLLALLHRQRDRLVRLFRVEWRVVRARRVRPVWPVSILAEMVAQASSVETENRRRAICKIWIFDEGSYSTCQVRAEGEFVMKNNYSRKIVEVHEWRGDLKRVELQCGHFVERAVWSGRPLPKSNRLACDSCKRASEESCPE